MVKQPVKESLGYITMSRIGLSLAREIGRHFDPVGIQYGMSLSSESKPSYDALRNVMENDFLFNDGKIIGHQSVVFKVNINNFIVLSNFSNSILCIAGRYKIVSKRQDC